MITSYSEGSSALRMEGNYSHEGFANYLSNPNLYFNLDLSNATLLEAIYKMAECRNRTSPNFGKHYSCLIHHLKGIQDDFGCILLPIHVTDIFWSNFVPYLIRKGLALSTIKTCCSQLKAAVDWAGKHRAAISDSYDQVRIPSYSHQQIALTPDEISHIAHFDIQTINKRQQYLRHLEKVRDMFVLSCNLGQRYSDMIRIDSSCFDRNIFVIMQQKTGVRARVDIEKMSMDRNTTYKILDRYGYRAPVTTDISDYNKYLKYLLQAIGGDFTESIRRETKVGGVIESKMTPKYKLICSHTARRSFITNNVLRGHYSLEIMRASGHKTYSAFEKYLCYFDD